METRANHALIGLFTLAVIAAAFGFVYWFKAAGRSGDRETYRIVFQGSVSGLSRGSPVRFNGLSVGDVTAISLVPDDPRLVQAIIAINPHTPVKADTRARLEYQGLTGVAAVQLTGGSSSAPPLTSPNPNMRPTIFADRSDFQDIMETAQRIAGRVDEAVGKVEKVIDDNQGAISSTIRNVETFSKALSDNSAGISTFLSSIGETSTRFSALSSRLDKLAVDLDDVVKAVDTKSINRIVGNADAISQTLADNRQNVSSTLTDLASLTKRLNDSSLKLDVALAEVTRITSAIDNQKVASVIDNVDKFSKVLGSDAAAIDQTIANAREISEKLNKSADRVDRVLAGAESFLGTNGEGNSGTQSMFAEITEAAKAFRTLSTHLDQRIDAISAGINRFTGSGRRDLEGLVIDARASLNQLNRTARSLQRAPDQLIFGAKPPLPTYNGNR